MKKKEKQSQSGENAKDGENKLLAVVRVRGSIGVRSTIKDTLRMLRLTRVNHCVLVPNTKSYWGMLGNVKDYVTYGEIDKKTLKNLISTRGRLMGDATITNDYLKAHTQFDNVQQFANALFNVQIKYGLKDIKPLIRLSPPKRGYEGLKHHYPVGALGYRGAAINELIGRMI